MAVVLLGATPPKGVCVSRAAAHAMTRRGSGLPVVVLAHGVGGCQRHWAGVEEALAARTTVVTYALSGSPQADPGLFSPTRHSAATGFADDIALLLAECDLRDVVYVGHSLSGIAGLLAAVANPAMFRAVVAINASPRYRDDPETGYESGLSIDSAREFLDAVMGDYVAWSAGFAPIAVGNLDRPVITRDFADSLLTYRPDVTAAMMRASVDGDHREVLPRVGVPVLIVQSPDDALVAESAGEWMAEHIPGARYRRVSSPGHFPQFAGPEELAAAIGEFVDEVG